MKNAFCQAHLLSSLFLLLTLPMAISAQSNLAGSWHGELDVQGTQLILTMDIHIDSAGQLAGFMHSPMQGANDIPIGRIELEGDSVRIGVSTLMATVRARLMPGDSLLTGEFNQGPFTLPITFRRISAPFEFARPQEPQRPFPYVEQEVMIPNEAADVILAGTITLPDTVGTFPAVILVTGSGPQDRNEEIMGHKPFLVISDYLTRRGVVVLRYDDRGFAGSTGDFASGTTYDFADDALAALRFLQQHPNVNPDAAGIIGHSEGGLIAQIIAARSDNPAAFIIMLAGPTISGEEILLSQIQRIQEVSGAPRRVIRRTLRDAKAVFEILKDATDSQQAAEQMEAFYAQRRARTREKHHATYGYNEEAVKQSVPAYTSPWFIAFLKTDPSNYLPKISVPMLALFGGKDVQVLDDLNIEALKTFVKQHNKTNFTWKSYPQRNHLFQVAETGSVQEYATIEETFGEKVMEEMLQFILQVTKQQ